MLVADDNSVNRLVTSQLVEALGYRVSAVADGRAAINQLTREAFDLVLMDCQMPELDGYQATEHIRNGEIRSEIPIIALTASAMKEDLERCLEAGMNDFLSKPCRLRDLEAILDRWLPV